MGRTHEFRCSDIEGTQHTYTVYPHPAGEGLQLLSELMAIGARGLRGALGAVQFDELSKGVASGNVGNLDAQIDEGMLGVAIGEVMQAIGERDALALAKRLLGYTVRDGSGMRGGKVDGASAGWAFDAIYAANYGELRTALVEVCRFNFSSFFGGLGGVGVLRKLAQTPI